MRPGAMAWVWLACLAVPVIAGEGGAESPPPAPEARVRWVLDRIEEEVAVIVGGEGERVVPRRSLGPGAKEGDLLDGWLVPDRAATARAREDVARLRARLGAAREAEAGAGSAEVGPP